MTVRSLGSGLIGVIGVYCLAGGVMAAISLWIAVMMSQPESMAGGIGIGLWISTVATTCYPIVLGLCLLIARRVFAAEDEILNTSGAPQWIAVLLLGMGLWFLVEAIATFMMYVEWGSTAHGFPFRLATIPTTILWSDGFRAVVGLLLVFRSGPIARMIEPVTRSV